MAGAAGTAWDVTRYADGEPHQMTYGGPSLSDPANFVFSGFPLGWQHWDDKGNATALNGAYSLESGFFDKIKFGTRYATQQSLYTNRGFGSMNLTTDGKPLAADRSNAIPASSKTDMLQTAPTNYMRGLAGYAGGYVVWNPDRLLGNQVSAQFPNAGIPDENNFPENGSARRLMKESTLAGYLVGDFSALDDRLKGNVGVRVVRTRSTAQARNLSLTQSGTLVDYARTTTYNNVLPTLNATYDIQKDFLARFGFGRGMTRPDLGSLNPSITIDTGLGTANMGNPDLRPQTATSYDFSLERYFSATNYVSAAVFDKQIKGFFSSVAQCMTVPFAPLYGGTANNCPNGQYMTSQQVNAAPGYARGAELSGQWFFGGDNWWKNFGVAGNYTYVKTSNPVNYGTAVAPVWITSAQPLASKNSYSISALYEDSKLSGRLVYTWRSSQLLGAVNAVNPLGSGYVGAYGLLDASLNYAIDDHLTLTLNGSNLTDKAPNRYVGESPNFEPNLLAQYFDNGRTISVGLRYKF
jgi:TonB-dependent receptor